MNFEARIPYVLATGITVRIFFFYFYSDVLRVLPGKFNPSIIRRINQNKICLYIYSVYLGVENFWKKVL